MERLIKLNEWDIVQVIADHYDVGHDKVALKLETTYEGCGPMEQPVCKATAIVREK